MVVDEVAPPACLLVIKAIAGSAQPCSISRSPLPIPCSARQVSKKLLLLYVQEPEGGADRSSPNALAQVAVHERLVRRWVPESRRLPPPGSK